jgi:cytochrome c biogenesis protein CcmG/thiol:disulfide interchange protein DsbE
MKSTLLTSAVLVTAIFSGTAAQAEEPALEASKDRAAITALHGKPAPALALKEWLNSSALTLGELKGKIVVLDFWATWCGPCIAAVPHTNELQAKYADKGVVIIGVCAVKGGEKMAETVKKHGIKYPVALDTGDTLKGYLANSFPDYYVIDRQGRLRWGDIVNKDVEKAIQALLAE